MISIDIRSNKPIYEQIIQQIKEGILKGYFKNGDILPSVRKLAIMLEINPNTVSKAYKEMERQNIIATIQGKGTFISNVNTDYLNDSKKIEIIDKLKPLILELKYIGLNEDDIIKIIRDINKKFEE